MATPILILSILLTMVTIIKIVAIYLHEQRRIFVVPDRFIPYYDATKYHKAQIYWRERNSAKVLQVLLSTFIIIIFLASENHIQLHYFLTEYFDKPQFISAFYWVIIVFGFFLLKIPLDAYEKIVLLNKNGYKGQSAWDYIKFILKVLILIPVFFSIAFLFIFYLYYYSHIYFWVIGLSLFYILKKTFNWFLPSSYHRYFVKNKDEIPSKEIKKAVSIESYVEDIHLRSEIISHCYKLKIPSKKVFIVKSGDYNKRARAFAVGSRIYIDERIFQSLNRKEFLAILSHEIWHTKNFNLLEMVSAPATKLLLFGLCSWLGFNLTFSQSLGLAQAVPHVNLFILILFWSVFVFIKNTMQNIRNHTNELKADAFARINVSAKATSSALCKMVGLDLSELGYSQLYYNIFSSHPSFKKRLENINKGVTS